MNDTMPEQYSLHVLIHPEHLSLLELTLTPADKIVLGGAALAVDISTLSASAVYGLAHDSTEWGIPLPDAVQSVSDPQWVTLAAQASRIIVW